MKKFTRILLCLILCVVSVCLFACGGGNPDAFFDNITKAENVIGNGGLAVQSNGYLYFVNGFKSNEDMYKQNRQNDSYNLGALMVAKLDENGNVYAEENGTLKDDYSRVMTDKLCGFEATSLYVFGEYLYFTSPCQEDERGAGWAYKRVDFYRVKLNKTSDVERIYQTNVDVDNDKTTFAIYGDNEHVYIILTENEIVKETGKQDREVLHLYKIDATKTKNNVEELEKDKDISSIKLSKDSNYIAYVVTKSTGYDLKIVNVLTGNTKTDSRNSDCEVEYISNNYVYIVHSAQSGQDKKILSRISLHGSSMDIVQLTYKFDSTLYISAEDNIIAVNNSDILIYKQKANPTQISQLERAVLVTDEDATITILGFANGSVVYIDNKNSIKTVSLDATNDAANIKTIASEVTGFNKTGVDFNINKLYFYKTVKKDKNTFTENEYLHQLSLLNEDSQVKFIGRYNQGDEPIIEQE